ncbi:MAG TPA: transcription antitermination factor NusB [Acidimicrobiales bacterium]
MSDSPYQGGVGSRREARERALGLLYEAESKSITPAAAVAALPLVPEPFTVELVEGVGDHLDEIDATIRAYAQGWTLERMPSLDRALLRIGIFELTFRPDVPTGAVISEAVELAKTFSTDDSGKFVNGLLSAVAADVRPA